MLRVLGVPGCCTSDAQCTECEFCELVTNTCIEEYSLRTLGTFVTCLSGPDVTVGPECTCADINQDGHVDLADFAAFQVSFHDP